MRIRNSAISVFGPQRSMWLIVISNNIAYSNKDSQTSTVINLLNAMPANTAFDVKTTKILFYSEPSNTLIGHSLC